MKTFKSYLLVILLGGSLTAAGQYTKEFKRIFSDAEYLYMTGFYEEAFSRYKNLLTLDPGNYNILFLCGACCNRIPGSEEEAITYLEEAVTGVTLDYKESSYKESGAPVLSYFMLGRACHLNHDFSRAVENYQRYLDAGTEEDPVLLEYTRLQIDACHRAENMEGELPSYEFRDVLDQFDQDLPSCNYPVVSGDGKILIFLVDYPNDKKIMMTRKEGEIWSRPRVINSEIGMVGETTPACLSYDGKELYLVHYYYSHSDIFVSRYEQGHWTQAEPLGHNVNSRTSETHASISRDGKTLYFTSNARGGQGSYDIYVSRHTEKGEWGVPENLGPVINTSFEEETPFISANDSVLFFSSQGHQGIGGFDVFYSRLDASGQWGVPRPLDPPVNTTGEDLFFNPGWSAQNGFYAVRRKDDPTSNTINMVIEMETPEPLAETRKTEAGEAEDEVQSQTVKKLSEVMEPEETEEIHQALNRPAEAVIPVPAAGSTPLQTSIPFDHNEYELSMAAMLELEKVSEIMLNYPGTRVHLCGHADATGTADYNLLLSGQRAGRIADYLEERGIDPHRIACEGRGESDPLARDRNADGSDAPLGRYLNRQVVVTLESPEPIPSELQGFYVPSRLKVDPAQAKQEEGSIRFTIQVCADFRPVGPDGFRGLTGVKEHICKDDYYRYTFGSYTSFQEARSVLDEIRESGYPDAFIQTVDWYTRAGL